jgi:hypothetical protein
VSIRNPWLRMAASSRPTLYFVIDLTVATLFLPFDQ